MRRVLVLRPEPAARATVEGAKRRGLDAISTPLFEIEAVQWAPPAAAGFDGILLTSANAVRFGGEGLQELRGLPVYAVGAATAAAARDAGFDVASTGDAGAKRLLGSIDPGLKLLHLAGEHRKEQGDAAQHITSVTVYRSTTRDNVDLSDAGGSVALIHSPRAGERFAELIADAKINASIAIAAISREAADAAGGGWERVEVADEPNDQALLALTERLCNNMPAT